MDDILQRVKEAIAEVQNIDANTIGDAANLYSDLGGDSVKIAEWVAAVECELNLEIDPNVTIRFKTIEDFVTYIKENG